LYILNGEKAKYVYEDNEGFFNDLYWGVGKNDNLAEHLLSLLRQDYENIDCR